MTLIYWQLKMVKYYMKVLDFGKRIALQ